MRFTKLIWLFKISLRIFFPRQSRCFFFVMWTYLKENLYDEEIIRVVYDLYMIYNLEIVSKVVHLSYSFYYKYLLVYLPYFYIDQRVLVTVFLSTLAKLTICFRQYISISRNKWIYENSVTKWKINLIFIKKYLDACRQV